MKLLLSNLKLNKVISILVIFITLGVAYLYYGNTYSLRSDSGLADAISEYIFNQDIKAEVELIHKEDEWLYVVFSDSRYGDYFKGLARLKHGWNGRYVIRSANYGLGYPISHYYFADGKGTFAIYGLFPDDRAVRYEYVNTVLTSLKYTEYFGDINQRVFVQVCKDGGTDFMGLRVYDSNGEDITKSYSATKINSVPEGTTVTTELFMVNVNSILIVVFGFILAYVLWFKVTWSRRQ